MTTRRRSRSLLRNELSLSEDQDQSTLGRLTLILDGSNAEATRALYAELEAIGPPGVVAQNLFRAFKTSSRAKDYRRGSHRRQSYDRKQWSLGNLCTALTAHAATSGVIAWGWRVDPAQAFHRLVLYVDLPTGQVSFHSEARCLGPDYPGVWDGARGTGGPRILRYCAKVLDGEALAVRPFLCDRQRHLACRPYTIEGLHRMADVLELGRHWFHAGRWPHYDIPVGRLAEISVRPDVELLTPRELLRVIKADALRRGAVPGATAAGEASSESVDRYRKPEQLGLL